MPTQRNGKDHTGNGIDLTPKGTAKHRAVRAKMRTAKELHRCEGPRKREAQWSRGNARKWFVMEEIGEVSQRIRSVARSAAEEMLRIVGNGMALIRCATKCKRREWIRLRNEMH